jgi:hypothetical protein
VSNAWDWERKKKKGESKKLKVKSKKSVHIRAICEQKKSLAIIKKLS